MSLKKIFSALAVTVIIIASFVISVSAEEIHVYGMDSMLTENDIERINAAAVKWGEEYGCDFYIVTHSADGRFEKYVGEDFIEENGFSYNDDILLLIITYDTAEREYYYNMYYYGLPSRRISDAEVDSILDDPDVYDNLKSGKLADGAIAFIELSGEASAMPWGVITVVAVVAAIVVGAITVSVVTAKYKMRMKPTNYPLDKYAKLELTDSDDQFIDKRVSVVITSSGGGSGGRGGGGGYGGGRGHAGGR